MWFGFSRDALREWPTFLALGVPGALMTCTEWCGFEIMAILAGVSVIMLPVTSTGLIGTIPLGANMIIMNTEGILFMIPLGLSVVGATRTGNALGANDPSRAKIVSRMLLVITACMQIFQVCLLLALHDVWAKVFTSDTDIISLVILFLLQYSGLKVAKVLPVCSGFMLFDGMQVRKKYNVSNF